jgi:hypothetical protein
MYVWLIAGISICWYGDLNIMFLGSLGMGRQGGRELARRTLGDVNDKPANEQLEPGTSRNCVQAAKRIPCKYFRIPGKRRRLCLLVASPGPPNTW